VCKFVFGSGLKYLPKEIPMPRVIVTTSALVIGLALASATDLAQNLQGPAAPNFGVNSNAQTGGMPNTGANAVTPSPDHENGATTHSGHARSKHATHSDGH
jgi:PAB1-binding protein PBP1